ncbi:MAG: LysR family transcriptional regulator [Oscillospiraceae bacterium]|nr:LysR family transcriptional regulator [Oscillospiraceae bacterium]
MNLNQLRYFVSVASLSSFTKAAERHYITQTSITQQIKMLEETLDVQLINRKKRPIELTPAGEVFYREAKAILERADEAISKTREASNGFSGTIRIGYEKGYERSNLSARLRSFHKDYPNILITCFRDDTEGLAKRLLADELDVIFSWDSTNLRIEPGICSKIDMHSRLCVALYSGHPLANKKELKRADLKDDAILIMSPSGQKDSFGDIHFMKLYEKAGYQPKILLESNDIESVLMMIDTEEGVAVIPSYSVEKLTNVENIVFIPLQGEDEFEDIYMIWKESSGNPALNCLIKYGI